jgi:hypothetical protein
LPARGCAIEAKEPEGISIETSSLSDAIFQTLTAGGQNSGVLGFLIFCFIEFHNLYKMPDYNESTYFFRLELLNDELYTLNKAFLVFFRGLSLDSNLVVQI